MGRGGLYGTLANGGTTYFAAKSDLSTLLDDLALVRPTQVDFVPRIWDMVFDVFRGELDRRSLSGADRAAVEPKAMTELRQNLLGGRVVSALTGSAPISGEPRDFVESVFDVHLVDRYGATEAGIVFVDDLVHRPPVIDYKLADVPDLGYFSTDQPHPRGELLVKSDDLFPGYYNRPEVTAEVFDADGYYRTGDIMAEVGPDRLMYLDRSNNVLKLSQGEFVTVSKLEAVFTTSPVGAADTSTATARDPYPLAVIVPTANALSRKGDDIASSSRSSAGHCRRLRKRRACSPTRSRATSSSRQRHSHSRTACSPASASWRGQSQGALRRSPRTALR